MTRSTVRDEGSPCVPSCPKYDEVHGSGRRLECGVVGGRHKVACLLGLVADTPETDEL